MHTAVDVATLVELLLVVDRGEGVADHPEEPVDGDERGRHPVSHAREVAPMAGGMVGAAMGGRDMNEAGPVIWEVPMEEEPVRAKEPPKLDVDRWWAEREQMIKALLERRTELTEQLDETERRLVLLGHAPARPTGGGTAEGPQPAVSERERMVHRVKAALTKEPELVATIAERAKLARFATLQALRILKDRGEAVARGRGGARWVRA